MIFQIYNIINVCSTIFLYSCNDCVFLTYVLHAMCSTVNSRDHLARGALVWHVCFFFFKCGSQLPRRMMMMAELVQGQASVAQPGTKDDFADTIRRVRQVNGSSANTGETLSHRRQRVCGRSRPRLWLGHPRS